MCKYFSFTFRYSFFTVLCKYVKLEYVKFSKIEYSNLIIVLILYRDNQEIKITSNTKITQEEDMWVLRIMKFSRTDTGVYKCVATNTVGTAECQCTVAVEGLYNFQN